MFNKKYFIIFKNKYDNFLMKIWKKKKLNFNPIKNFSLIILFILNSQKYLTSFIDFYYLFIKKLFIYLISKIICFNVILFSVYLIKFIYH